MQGVSAQYVPSVPVFRSAAAPPSRNRRAFPKDGVWPSCRGDVACAHYQALKASKTAIEQAMVAPPERIEESDQEKGSLSLPLAVFDANDRGD